MFRGGGKRGENAQGGVQFGDGNDRFRKSDQKA